jgi:hypothetical protein
MLRPLASARPVSREHETGLDPSVARLETFLEAAPGDDDRRLLREVRRNVALVRLLGLETRKAG